MPSNDAPKRAIGTPRGTKDMGFKEAIALNETLSVIEETFKRFGFSPIDTPAIENLDVINAKAYGDESTKEIYVLDGKEVGLRYDFTVPLARYVSMNKDLSLPFKRYQIGKVWRKDEPQYMRSREFVQADIDIVGSSELECEAEIIGATASALDLLGITDYEIHLNHREMLNAILASFKVPEDRQVAAIRILDKLAKQSVNDTTEQLVGLGIEREAAEKLLAFMTSDAPSSINNSEMDGSAKAEQANSDKLNKIGANSDVDKKKIEEMKSLLTLLKKYEIKGRPNVDFSLARGLDYYTGFVWEFVAFDQGKRLPSIASGGRYDDLISLFLKNKMPAVGNSIGVSRIMELFKAKETVKSYVKAFVAQIGTESKDYAFSICKQLRANGIYTDINLTTRSISKQLEYANSRGARFAVIVGNQEKAANKAKLRDMISGSEELLDLDELLTKIKSA